MGAVTTGDRVDRADRVPKQDRSRATRQRLLEAAVSCLAEHGWAGSTVSVVAERAGVSRGAAQHHFPTRGDLVTAAILHMGDVRLAELQPTHLPPADGPARTRAALERLAELYTGALFTAALHVWAEAAVDPELRARVVVLEHRLAQEGYALAVALLGVDGDDPVVRPLVAGTLDLVRGLALADVLTDDSRRRARILDAWAEQLDRALHGTHAQTAP